MYSVRKEFLYSRRHAFASGALTLNIENSKTYEAHAAKCNKSYLDTASEFQRPVELVGLALPATPGEYGVFPTGAVAFLT